MMRRRLSNRDSGSPAARATPFFPTRDSTNPRGACSGAVRRDDGKSGGRRCDHDHGPDRGRLRPWFFAGAGAAGSASVTCACCTVRSRLETVDSLVVRLGAGATGSRPTTRSCDRGAREWPVRAIVAGSAGSAVCGALSRVDDFTEGFAFFSGDTGTVDPPLRAVFECAAFSRWEVFAVSAGFSSAGLAAAAGAGGGAGSFAVFWAGAEFSRLSRNFRSASSVEVGTGAARAVASASVKRDTKEKSGLFICVPGFGSRNWRVVTESKRAVGVVGKPRKEKPILGHDQCTDAIRC